MINHKQNLGGQVWIETVIYTVIGISLIAVVLSLVTPRINQAREKVIVDQAIASLQNLDETINIVMDKGDGNRRIIGFSIKRGSLIFDTAHDKVMFEIGGLMKAYSEVNVTIRVGKVAVLSTQKGTAYSTTLTLSYPFNMTYLMQEPTTPRAFGAAPTPYNFALENKQNTLLNVEEVSQE